MPTTTYSGRGFLRKIKNTGFLLDFVWMEVMMGIKYFCLQLAFGLSRESGFSLHPVAAKHFWDFEALLTSIGQQKWTR